MMTYNIIATGSKGNAVVLNDCILIDCGVSFSKLSEVFSRLKIVLLTHEHSDHFNSTTIRLLAQNRPALRFGCGKWLIERLVKCGVSKKNIDIYETGKKYDYGAFAVSPVKLYHDVPNVGYRVYMGGKKAFYATDTATLDGITAKNYDLYMVEANYEDKEIRRRIAEKRKNGEYPYELGVLHTHLSKRQCDNFIYENIGKNGVYVYLHGHEGAEI